MSLLTRPDRTGGAAAGPGTAPRSVNLLPPETAERNRARVVARRFVIAGLGIVAVGAAVWTAQFATIQAAQDELAAAQAAHAAAQARLAPLLPVKAFSAELAQQQELVSTSMAGHTSFSGALERFGAAWPAGSSLRTLEATRGQACPGPDPFQGAAGVACLTWTVTVPGEQQVRDLVAALESTDGLGGPYLTSAVRNTGDYDATGTVNVQDGLLTGRFGDPATTADATPGGTSTQPSTEEQR